jgi:hypothetical protein
VLRNQSTSSRSANGTSSSYSASLSPPSTGALRACTRTPKREWGDAKIDQKLNKKKKKKETNVDGGVKRGGVPVSSSFSWLVSTCSCPCRALTQISVGLLLLGAK